MSGTKDSRRRNQVILVTSQVYKASPGEFVSSFLFASSLILSLPLLPFSLSRSPPAFLLWRLILGSPYLTKDYRGCLVVGIYLLGFLCTISGMRRNLDSPASFLTLAASVLAIDLAAPLPSYTWPPSKPFAYTSPRTEPMLLVRLTPPLL